jgi:transposase-like protein
LIKVGSEFILLDRVIIEPKDKEILLIILSKDRERNMFVVTERFISKVVEKHGSHPVSTDGERTWYLIKPVVS